jgi:hypothetical protein
MGIIPHCKTIPSNKIPDQQKPSVIAQVGVGDEDSPLIFIVIRAFGITDISGK